MSGVEHTLVATRSVSPVKLQKWETKILSWAVEGGAMVATVEGHTQDEALDFCG